MRVYCLSQHSVCWSVCIEKLWSKLHLQLCVLQGVFFSLRFVFLCLLKQTCTDHFSVVCFLCCLSVYLLLLFCHMPLENNVIKDRYLLSCFCFLFKNKNKKKKKQQKAFIFNGELILHLMEMLHNLIFFLYVWFSQMDYPCSTVYFLAFSDF